MATWGERVCAACDVNLRRGSYSRTQWSLGVGVTRCISCVSGGKLAADSSARRNLSRYATFAAEPFAEGSFKRCFFGVFLEGARSGQPCVVKFFRDRGVASSYFAAEISIVNKTLELLSQWNGARFISQTVRLNVPEIWPVGGCGRLGLVEPFIENFAKFNSNTGWTTRDGSSWCALMQALSHYSYHVSSGMALLCELQGGIFADGAILTDAVIMSSEAGAHGPADLGREGIVNFFAYHECGAYCKAEWTRPHEHAAYFYPTAATTMRHSGPTAPHGAPFMTSGAIDDDGEVDGSPPAPHGAPFMPADSHDHGDDYDEGDDDDGDDDDGGDVNDDDSPPAPHDEPLMPAGSPDYYDYVDDDDGDDAPVPHDAPHMPPGSPDYGDDDDDDDRKPSAEGVC